jgi:hypothetical protein
LENNIDHDAMDDTNDDAEYNITYWTFEGVDNGDNGDEITPHQNIMFYNDE